VLSDKPHGSVHLAEGPSGRAVGGEARQRGVPRWEHLFRNEVRPRGLPHLRASHRACCWVAGLCVLRPSAPACCWVAGLPCPPLTLPWCVVRLQVDFWRRSSTPTFCPSRPSRTTAASRSWSLSTCPTAHSPPGCAHPGPRSVPCPPPGPRTAPRSTPWTMCLPRSTQPLVPRLTVGVPLVPWRVVLLVRSRHAPLTFAARVDIGLGMADALCFLHSFSKPSIIHRDVVSDSVLLDAAMQPRLGSLGLLEAPARARGCGCAWRRRRATWTPSLPDLQGHGQVRRVASGWCCWSCSRRSPRCSRRAPRRSAP